MQLPLLLALFVLMKTMEFVLVHAYSYARQYLLRPAELPSRTVVQAYAEILGMDVEQAERVVRMCLARHTAETNLGYFFHAQHSRLRGASFVPGSRRKTATIEGDKCRLLSTGAFGAIWKGARGNVYKVVHVRSSNEGQFREVFVECLVQCILQNDDVYGRNIAKLHSLSQINRTPQGTSAFVCKMEHVAFGIDEFLETRQEGPVGLPGLAPVFRQLGSILHGLHQRYGFHHRDLHGGNVMFTRKGTVKIIDFGFSCITLNGHVFSRENAPCQAFDPLVFLASLYTNETKSLFRKDAQERIEWYFTGSDRTNWLHFIESWLDQRRKQDKDVPHDQPFHYFYHHLSLGNALTEPDDFDAQPWGGLSSETPRRRRIVDFMQGGMPERGTYEFFAKAWERDPPNQA